MTTLLRLLEPTTSSSDAPASSDKPVLFILDEFDLFALHPRQSFLYCLLDIVQGNKRRAGVGVIGSSCRTVSPFLPNVSGSSLTRSAGLSLRAGKASAIEMSISRSANRRRKRLLRLHLSRTLTPAHRCACRFGRCSDDADESLERRSRGEFSLPSSSALADGLNDRGFSATVK